MNYLLITLGAIIALLERFVSAYGKQGFNFKKFLHLNIGLFLLNFIVGVSSVIAIYNLNDGFVVKFDGWDATGIFWLMVGALGHYIWKLLIVSFKKFVIEKLSKKSKKSKK